MRYVHFVEDVEVCGAGVAGKITQAAPLHHYPQFPAHILPEQRHQHVLMGYFATTVSMYVGF